MQSFHQIIIISATMYNKRKVKVIENVGEKFG